MQFKIEQVALAINPEREAEAFWLLEVLGITEWAVDYVTAKGKVFGAEATNLARLSFNYTALEQARELEILTYSAGRNWLAEQRGTRSTQPTVASHIGMHCTEEELTEWRTALAHLTIAQEVWTQEHTNPVIAGKRWYHYVIFEARHIIGVDIKFIVRRDER